MSSFTDLVERFVRERHAHDPVGATIAGVHDHDSRLGDLRGEGWARRNELAESWLAQFSRATGAGWPANERIDNELLIGQLRGEVALAPFERWRRDPSMYSDQITRGAYYALIRDETPLDDRLAQLAERLEQAPAALDAARANLDPDRVPPVWVVVAGETATAGATFVRAVLPSQAPDGAPAKPALIAAGKRAGDALDAYASWLRDDLMRRARGSFAIGRGAFDALLRDKELLPYDAGTLKRFGEELYRETEAKLSDAAAALGDKDWRISVARLRDDHPSEDQLVAAYETEMQRSRQATIAADLATLSEGESLEVEAMPEFSRSTYPYAAYVGPGPFERSRRGRFWVTLPLPNEPATVKRERLEGHPRKGIAVIACHEGYPGHHLQLGIAADGASLARRAVRSNVFIEGWGLYVEELMTELGHLDDPETRLLRLKDLLWRAARVVVDVGLHTGEMSFEQAVAFMVDGPKLERPNAVGEVRRYTLNPLQPSSYALGRASLLELRERARSAGWTMRQFHDRMLQGGSLPPALAAREAGL